MDNPQIDELLVEEVARGEPAAWRRLIERYEGRLMAFARARIASHADAEDIVQEAFVGFLQSLGNYDPSRSLETYLFAILRYKISDLFKRRGSRPLTTIDDDAILDGAYAAAQPASDTPSRHLGAQENREARARILGEALRRLIYDFRDQDKFEDLQVIELSFYVGRRNKDIAALLELDEKHVAGVKFRAIAKVRHYCTEQGLPESPATDSVEITDVTVTEIWRARRLTCLKRSTLGSYLLGVLDEPWLSYTQFHLDVVACPMCLANYEDLRAASDEALDPVLRERIFASSAGFLSRRSEVGT
jgi:RNA polymerase sigma-70 factor (ECF subfamily)